MLILGSTSEGFSGPREVRSPPIPDDGWLLADDVSVDAPGLVVHLVSDLESALELSERSVRPIGLMTSTDGFPTVGDLAGNRRLAQEAAHKAAGAGADCILLIVAGVGYLLGVTTIFLTYSPIDQKPGHG